MLSDINIEFPSLLGQLDKRLADSLTDVSQPAILDFHEVIMAQDFFAFPETCNPSQMSSRGDSTISDFTTGHDLTNEAADMLNLDEFDLSQDNPDTWDLNLFGLSPFPSGRI